MNKRLKELRESIHLSQELLGKQLNMSQQTVSRLESDLRYMTLEQLLLYSDFFKVSTDFLLERSGNPSTDYYVQIINEEIYEYYNLVKMYQCLNEEHKEILWSLIEKLFQLENQKVNENAGNSDL